MTGKIKISKSTVVALKHPTSGQPIYWDKSLPGFGLRIGAKRKTYIVQKKINGKDVKVSLGVHGQVTAEQARKMAVAALAEMTKGINPLDKKREAKAKGVTLQEAYEDLLEARKDYKSRTIKDIAYSIDTYFGDWKNKAIAEISKDMVSKRHKKIGNGKGGKAQANLAMRYLRAIINFAKSKYSDSKGKAIIESNPIDIFSETRSWYKVERRQTVIKPHELPLLFDAMDELLDGSTSTMNQTAVDYIQFLLLTGMRKQEGATLEWKQVDFEDQSLTLTDTKSGNPLNLPLSDYLMKMLKRRSKTKVGDYIFHASDNARPLRDPKRQLNKIKELSGLSFSCHDLRRTFITIAESMDISTYAIKKPVNHSTGGDVTSGYIIHNVERLRKPMQQITNKILSLACLKDKGKVVKIHG